MSDLLLPNIRKQFIPDEGYVIIDADLSGADAQVVAWEADDAEMKAAFRAGMKIHVKNVQDMFPEWAEHSADDIKQQPIYKASKILCHATNYVGGPPTIATNVHWPIATVADFQTRWFAKHPGIKEWHNRTARHLDGSQCWNCDYIPDPTNKCPSCGVLLGRTIRNRFGYSITFNDYVDKLLPTAVAWIPQSTVANVTTKGMILLEDTYPFVEMLIQVHDSLVFQIPKSELSSMTEVEATLNSIAVPYADPLYIPWGIAISDENWGECG